MLRVSTSDAVYRSLHGDVRRWFARRAPPDAVDDLVQEAFLRIHRGLPALREADRLEPWVFRICRSVLVDTHRRSRPEEPLVEEPQVEAPLPDGATAVVAGWMPAFVEQLPEPYREAVRLTELEGLSQAELARRLGLSASGARTRVQRGRALLREALLACCHVVLEEGEVVDVRPRQCGCETGAAC